MKYQVQFDGYAFGDRLLEGVMFRATLEKNTVSNVHVSPDGLEYFEELNQAKWLKEAEKYLKDLLKQYDNNCLDMIEEGEVELYENRSDAFEQGSDEDSLKELETFLKETFLKEPLK